MKKLQTIILFTVVAIALYALSVPVIALGGRPQPVDPDVFMQWYEENKDNESDTPAVFTLTGDLTLSKDIILDGEGSVKLDCGKYLVQIAGNVTFDNPNLEIAGCGWNVVFVTSPDATLTLKRGTILGEGLEDGAALAVMQGSLETSDRDDPFLIRANGKNVSGVGYYDTATSPLEGVDLEVSGENAIGVQSKGNIAIKKCTVRVSGTDSAYGVQAFGSIQVEESEVRAEGTQDNADAWSLFSVTGKGIDVDALSVLVPALSTPTPPPDRAYFMTGIVQYNDSNTICLPQGAEDGIKALPTSLLCTYLPSDEAALPIEKSELVDVIWEEEALSNLLEAPGRYQLQGTWEEARLEALDIDPREILPEITVQVTEGNQTAIEGVTIGSSFEDKTRLLFTVNFPTGGTHLFVDYSTDGQNWERIKTVVDGNPIDTDYLDGVPEKEQLTSLLLLPEEITLPIYLRTEVVGGWYEGVGPSFRVEAPDSGTVSPGANDDSNGGDRGGEQSTPARKPVLEPSEGLGEVISSKIPDVFASLLKGVAAVFQEGHTLMADWSIEEAPAAIPEKELSTSAPEAIVTSSVQKSQKHAVLHPVTSAASAIKTPTKKVEKLEPERVASAEEPKVTPADGKTSSNPSKALVQNQPKKSTGVIVKVIGFLVFLLGVWLAWKIAGRMLKS